ncbi:MAG: type II toxin-antitoxin system RelE/ParE family toxin [Gammaproteobacteria bacterium]|nr:type II toxin-antitoxin system RelE/ParE family toxin [Gammaproteobacteria bacterium]
MHFKCSKTQQLFNGEVVKSFEPFRRIAERKLQQLDDATEIRDLKSPPGNRLEKLKGDREGAYSIRINDQFRICFRWQDGQAIDVEIVDYH